MQINKVEINNFYNLNSNNNKINYHHLSFEGDSFKKSEEKQNNAREINGPFVAVRSKIVLNSAKKLKEEGKELLSEGRDYIQISQWSATEATNELNSAQATLDELNDEGKGIIYYPNGTIRAVLNGDNLIELDNKRNIIRNASVDEDKKEVLDVEYIENGVRINAIKMQNGIKVMEGVSYPKDEVTAADRVYTFDEYGSLKTYVRNHARKVGKNGASSKADLKVNYKWGTPSCISRNVKSKQGVSTSDLKYTYSREGDILSVEVNSRTDNNKTSSASEKYTYSNNPYSKQILSSYEKKYSKEGGKKTSSLHVEYDKNNKMLFAVKS